MKIPTCDTSRSRRSLLEHAGAPRGYLSPAGEDIVLPGAEVPLDPPGFYLVNARSTVVLIGR